MFGLYFGNYLVEKNKISQSQLDDLIGQQKKTHVKLGLIAVSEKLLTTRQAEEINNIQKLMDRRFGDIAIEKGYLLAEEVTYLLNVQGNPYLQFVQTCTDNNILTIQEIEDYIEDFKNDNKFSDTDLDALKSGDIDRIIPIFIDMDAPLCAECAGLAIRNIVRFINNDILLKKAYTVPSYPFGVLSCQKMAGDHEIFVGLAGKEKELLQIANPFAKENYSEMNEDAFDSVCEFINCTNGLYASKLSHEDIQIDMMLPMFYRNMNVTAKGDILVVPIMINGVWIDLLVAVNSQARID